MAGNRRAARVFYNRKKKVKMKKNDARKKKNSHFHMLLLFDPEEDKKPSGVREVESILLSIILTLGYRGEGIICFDLDNESDSMDSDILELIRLNCDAENYRKNSVLYWKKKKVKMKNGVPGENLLQKRCTSATSGQIRCLNVCTRVRIWLRKYARLLLRRLLLTFAGKIIKTLRLRDLSGRQSRSCPRSPVNAVFDPGMKVMPNYLVLVHLVNKSVICIANDGNNCRCFMEEFCYKSYITNAYCSGILVYAVSKKILKMTSLYFQCETWQLSIRGLVRCLINSDLNGAYSLNAKSSNVDTYSYTAISLRDICPDKRTARLNGHLERKYYFWWSKKHQHVGFLLSSASVDLTGYEDFVLFGYTYGFVSVITDIPYKFVFPVLVVFVSSECVENICSSRRVEQIVKYTSLPGVCDYVSVYADETVFEKLLVITEYLKSISKGNDNNSHFKWINGYLVGVNLFQSKKKNQFESLLKWINEYLVDVNLSQSKKNQYEFLLKWINECLVGVKLSQSKKNQYEFLLKWINEYLVGVKLSQSKKNQYEFLLEWINEYLGGVNLSRRKKNQYEPLLKWINEFILNETWSLSESHICNIFVDSRSGQELKKLKHIVCCIFVLYGLVCCKKKEENEIFNSPKSYLSLFSKVKCICKFLQSSDDNSLICNTEVSCKASNDIVCRSWCNVADVCKCSQPRNMNLYYTSTSCECDSSRWYHFWNAASRIMDSSGSYFQKSDKYDLARFIDHMQHICDLSEIRNEWLLFSFITDDQSRFIDQQHTSDLSEIRNEGLLYSFITDDNESMVYFGSLKSCSNEPSYKRCFPDKYDIGEQIKVTNNSSIDKSSLAVINDNLLYSLFSCKSLLDKHLL